MEAKVRSLIFLCYKDIEYQQKIIENDGIRENEGDSPPMSKTMPKQGSEGK